LFGFAPCWHSRFQQFCPQAWPKHGDGIISAVEGDIDTQSDGFADNSRLFLPPTVFNRFAATREIDDGY